MGWRGLRLWLTLGLAALLLFLAFRQVNLAQVSRSLLAANPAYLALAILLYFGELWLRSIRWKYLLRPLKDMVAWRLYPVLVLGYTANNLLPVRAGELVRAWLVSRREGLSSSTALATVAVERVFDGLTALVLLIAVTPFIFFPHWLWRAVIIAAAAFAGVLALCLALMIYGEKAAKLFARVQFFLPVGLRAWLIDVFRLFVEGLRVLRHRRETILVLALSPLIWLVATSLYYMVGQALGVSLPPWGFLLLACVIALGMAIPAAPGYLGTYEVSAMAALALLLVPLDVAATMTVLAHAVLFFPVVAVGLGLLWRGDLSLSSLVSEVGLTREAKVPAPTP